MTLEDDLKAEIATGGCLLAGRTGALLDGAINRTRALLLVY